jgi:uncharacterized protein YdeI (YjbR/CyaY-like superfamily)
MQRYQELNPSMQRNICYWVNSAKRIETRTQRAVEMLNRLMNDSFKFGGSTVDKK